MIFVVPSHKKVIKHLADPENPIGPNKINAGSGLKFETNLSHCIAFKLIRIKCQMMQTAHQ
jgi:hypothetical protein